MASAVAATSSVTALSAVATKASVAGGQYNGATKALPVSYAMLKQSSFAGRSLAVAPSMRSASQGKDEMDCASAHRTNSLRSTTGVYKEACICCPGV